MAEAGDGSGHTPLTPEWTPAARASHYPWQGDRPAAAPSYICRISLDIFPRLNDELYATTLIQTVPKRQQ